MKEQWDLSTEQITFLYRVIDKIDSGWSLYSYNTKRGIQRCIDRGTYDRGNKEYYNELRKDYIESFCK